MAKPVQVLKFRTGIKSGWGFAETETGTTVHLVRLLQVSSSEGVSRGTSACGREATYNPLPGPEATICQVCARVHKESNDDAGE